MKWLLASLLLLSACTIRPDVTVEKPIVNVTMCLEVVGREILLVECEAGSSDKVGSNDAGGG